MSARFRFPTKLNPIWWLLNADDVPPPGYTAWTWWLRNPFHNLLWYVIGCADRRHRHIGVRDNWRDGGGLHAHLILQAWPPFLCPFVSWQGRRIEAYCGWRFGGAFGIALRRRVT